MMRLLLFCLALLLSGRAEAYSLSLITGPQDPSQMNATINGVINQMNAILIPTFPNVMGSVNALSFSPAVTGAQASIGLQSGSDANAGILINPNGSGNAILFGQTDTGVLQIGNPTSFVKTTGLIACPAKGFGVAPVVTGAFVIQDWMGVNHAVPGC